MAHWDLAASAWSSFDTSNVAPKPDATPLAAPSSVSPDLELDIDDLAAGHRGDRAVTVVITFTEDQILPRFPEPDPTLARDDPKNQATLQTVRSMAQALENARKPGLDQISSTLKGQYGAVEVGRFWLIKGLTVQIPLSAVSRLLSRADLQYVEYDQTNVAPPANHISDGRALLNTDYYFGGYSWIGDLDTGIRTSHVVLSTVYSYLRDCVNGTSSDCAVGSNLNPDDDCWNHGTSVVNILSGNNNLGNDFRGVTPIPVDSWKVYPSGCGGYNTSAIVRAFQAALDSGDTVIVGEIQAAGSDTSSISTAADNAFDVGALVVVAAGNNGPGGGSVSAPGNAHKVLAMGAVDVTSLALQNYSGRGPSPHGRIKPDLVSPTNVYAASTASNTATQLFGGTSCATPFAAGATALARNFMSGGGAIDPGQVYAFMILGGNQPSFDNNSGAGLSTILTGGTFWWGKVSVTYGQDVDIPINASPTHHMNASLWWPDPSASLHSDVDLQVFRPDGTLEGWSESSPSVFEKASVTSGLQSGTWKIRVIGYNVSGTQNAYYAVHAL